MEADHNDTTRAKPTKIGGGNPSDLMTSAKLIGEAAKCAMAHDTSNIDKAQLAAASADLLAAAKRYGKLDDKGLGMYLEKAETFLNHYHSSNSNAAPSAVAHHGGDVGHGHSSGGASSGGTSYGYLSGGGSDGGIGHGHSSGFGGTSHAHSGDGGGGGYGDYIKMAQGLLNKQDHGGNVGSSGGGGYGDYIKVAQGLLNKQDHSIGDNSDSGHGHSSGGGAGGYGDYIKMAQGLLNK